MVRDPSRIFNASGYLSPSVTSNFLFYTLACLQTYTSPPIFDIPIKTYQATIKSSCVLINATQLRPYPHGIDVLHTGRSMLVLAAERVREQRSMSRLPCSVNFCTVCFIHALFFYSKRIKSIKLQLILFRLYIPFEPGAVVQWPTDSCSRNALFLPFQASYSPLFQLLLQIIPEPNRNEELIIISLYGSVDFGMRSIHHGHQERYRLTSLGLT